MMFPVRTRSPGKLLVASVLILALTGCGAGTQRPPTFTVSGKVTFQGNPVAVGIVTFEDSSKGSGGSGELAVGGTYSTKLPAGQYRVMITPPQIEVTSPDASPEWKPKEVADIPDKYRRFETSELNITVDAKTVKHDFEMKP